MKKTEITWDIWIHHPISPSIEISMCDRHQPTTQGRHQREIATRTWMRTWCWQRLGPQQFWMPKCMFANFIRKSMVFRWIPRILICFFKLLMHQQRCVPTFWPSPKGNFRGTKQIWIDPATVAVVKTHHLHWKSIHVGSLKYGNPSSICETFKNEMNQNIPQLSRRNNQGQFFFQVKRVKTHPPWCQSMLSSKPKWLLHKSEVLHDVFVAQGALGLVVIRGWVPPPLASTGLPDFPTSQPFPLNAEKPKEGEQKSHGDRQFLQSRC